MNQLDLFNSQESQRAKDRGQQQAAEANPDLLELARSIAVDIAKRTGTVNADQVQYELVRRGFDIKALGNAAGSLFRGKFVHTGNYVRSIRKHAHGNRIGVWRLKC